MPPYISTKCPLWDLSNKKRILQTNLHPFFRVIPTQIVFCINLKKGVMKIPASIFILILLFTGSCSTSNAGGKKIADGTYIGRSCAQYTAEPFVGKVTIKIEKQKIVKVDFQITDTLTNERFGADYDKHYPDNKMYQDQCHNDWKGVQLYPNELFKKQDISQVDAVTGATWSYNIFKASVNEALKNAKK